MVADLVLGLFMHGSIAATEETRQFPGLCAVPSSARRNKSPSVTMPTLPAPSTTEPAHAKLTSFVIAS